MVTVVVVYRSGQSSASPFQNGQTISARKQILNRKNCLSSLCNCGGFSESEESFPTRPATID